MTVEIKIIGENAAQAHQEIVSLHSLFTAPSAAHTEQSAYQAPAASAQQVLPTQQQPSYQQPTYGQQPSAQQGFGLPLQQGYGQQAPTQQYGQQPPAQTGTVPTASAPAYSLDQLGVAAQPVMDAGRQAELVGWLQQHGAGALTQLDPQHYGEFATFLRSLGARI